MIHYQNKQVSTTNNYGKERGGLENKPHTVFKICPMV